MVTGFALGWAFHGNIQGDLDLAFGIKQPSTLRELRLLAFDDVVGVALLACDSESDALQLGDAGVLGLAEFTRAQDGLGLAVLGLGINPILGGRLQIEGHPGRPGRSLRRQNPALQPVSGANPAEDRQDGQYQEPASTSHGYLPV